MHTTELHDRLRKLDEKSLLDIVKNYKQYGYTNEVRAFAITLLEEKGVDNEMLALAGNLRNDSFERATELYSTYKRTSLTAFCLYLLLFFSRFSQVETLLSGYLLLVGTLAAGVAYLFFLIRSSVIQGEFYRCTGDEYGSDGALIYLFLGMPFYVVMYFVFRAQMREKMKTIK